MLVKSNAPGQLLGYTIEYPRALCHLLKSGPGDFVCVEYLGDVATLKSNINIITEEDKSSINNDQDDLVCAEYMGDIEIHKSNFNIITEEDKSSINSNPLTDKSVDLWKTFFNWINLINIKKLDVKKAKFILYCNQSGRDGIVNCFSSAQSQVDAQRAIDYAKTELGNIHKEHEIWKYYDFVINQNETLLLDIIERFELHIGSSTGYEEVRYEIQCKCVPENQIEYLMHKLNGWLQEQISNKITDRRPAIISWEEFNHQFLALFTRVRNRELIDFALQRPLKNDIHNQVKIRPVYLRQLEAINVSDEEIIDAICDYLRAEVNREEWIEKEIIDEDTASDFEKKLREFWKNQAKRVEITEKGLSEEQRGQLLLLECKSRKETIGDRNPPHSTIPGTYHALADESSLGWHPNWRKIFPNKKEEYHWGD